MKESRAKMLRMFKKQFWVDKKLSGNRSFQFSVWVALLGLVVLLYLSGCATTPMKSGKPRSVSPKTAGKAGVQQVEDLNPETLPDSLFEISGQTELLNPGPEATPTQKPTGETSGQVMVEEKPGYRVQIAALSNQEEAMQIKKEAMLKFSDQGVYLIFDPPFYKIRVGDFVSRYDAEKLQQKAVQLGYKDAWIVRTRVKIQKIE